MTNNPVPLDRPHVYAFSTKRLVLLASMVLTLIALGMMLGIRIERQQQAQVMGHRPSGGTPAQKMAALPTGSALKKEKSTPEIGAAQTREVKQIKAATSETKKVAKAVTSTGAESEPAESQPAPKPVTAPVKQAQPVAEPTATEAAVEAEKPVASEKTVRRGHYAVQVEASQDKAKADLQVEILKKKGLKAYIDQVDLGEKGRFFRVMVGPFQTKTQAKEARNTLSEDSRFTGSFIKYIP
jgi:cell division septation protein DedD